MNVGDGLGQKWPAPESFGYHFLVESTVVVDDGATA